MKIEKLILKNFSSISNALNCKEIELDFSKSENKICLLIGPNGSGKTSILSMLHPFSELGNLDVRSNLPLILEDKDGYKEIHIRRNEDYYVIKHYYTHHKGSSHTVKSYIYKNGDDLNPNGNVTSFKEMVKIELGIETDYLKLIRMGPNVASLIKLSATERKKFMSKLLDEIGVYLDYYKAINAKLTQVQDLMSHDVDKLKKLNIVDIEDVKSQKNDMNRYIEDLHSKYISVSNELAILEDKLSHIEDKENLRYKLIETSNKLKKMTNILERKNQIESFEASFYTERIASLENERSLKQNTFDNNIAMIQNSLDLLNSFQEQYRVYEVQFNKDNEIDKELKRMEDALTSKRLKLREYESILPLEYDIKVTKEEVESLFVFLKNTQIVLSHTYEFGQLVVEKVVELIRNRKNVTNYISKHLMDIDDTFHQRGSLFMNMISSKIKEDTSKKLESCDTACPARDLYFQVQNLLKDSQVTDKNNDTDFYKSMEYANDNLTSVLSKFADYKDIIERLPDGIRKDFILDTIYNKISKMQIIYDEKKFNDLLSLVTEYDNYQKLLVSYSNDEEMLEKFKSVSNLGNTVSQLELAKENIDSVNQKISIYRSNNSKLKDEIGEIDKTLEIYNEILETIEKYDEINSLHQKYSEDYALMRELDESIYQKKVKLTELDLSINEAKEKLSKISNDILQYNAIQKEMGKLNKIYDDTYLIKRASSSKEGIPLFIIRNYLDNTEDITNELLDIAYGGKKYIDKFDISSTEFSIPCYINGIRLPDVKYASQGELSFLEIALNFALSSQALRHYNVMLLDEVDGALDNTNREKFIKIVENQSDRIDAEQIFCITHNVFFSSYPVDIVDLSFKHDTETYQLASYIPIKIDGKEK